MQLMTIKPNIYILIYIGDSNRSDISDTLVHKPGRKFYFPTMPGMYTWRGDLGPQIVTFSVLLKR